MLREKVKNQTYIIAEAGINHNGDIQYAYQLIDMAKKAGADAIKFQMSHADLLCSEFYQADIIDLLNQYAIPKEEMRKFKDYAGTLGLDFIVTPFDMKSLDEVLELGCDIIKIASGEVKHTVFLEAAAKSGKDMIISTGSSYLSDVERAVATVQKYTSAEIGLFHCVSSYPAPYEALNINAVTTLKNAFPDCVVGYSDHSIGSTASVAAVTLGAQIIEKHITLDKKLEGPDHMASADYQEFEDMVKAIRLLPGILGSGEKAPQKCEPVLGRSIVATKAMVKGTRISAEDLDYKRPGDGIQSYERDKFVGAVLTRDIQKNEKFEWEHIIDKQGE